MYEYLIGVLLLMIIWLVLYLIRKDLRNEMIYASLLYVPLGLSDFIFIPWYWNPQTLFNLVPGIESFIFAFGIGGIASILYEEVFGKHLKKTKKKNS